jgi:ABC-type branched-subunit amino acid transport system substrate-binding protein
MRLTRRDFLRRTGGALGSAALAGSGLISLAGCGGDDDTGSGDRPIRVGLLLELTGALGYAGQTQHNMAQIWRDDINQAGGILGRQVELVVEDSASDPATGTTKARKLVQEGKVDVVIGGITSAMRNAIKGEITDRGKKLYFYGNLYEGLECDPNIFCTGPVPAQQVDPVLQFVMDDGAKTFYLPSADYIWPHTLNARVNQIVQDAGGQVVGEEYFPLDVTDLSASVNKIMNARADVVFVTLIPPGVWTFLQQLHDAGYQQGGGRVVIVWMDEGALPAIQPQYIEGLISCLDFYRDSQDSFTQEMIRRYDERFNDDTIFSAGTNAGGLYRALQMWSAAVEQAESTDREKVAEQLDGLRIERSFGGPIEMVQGQHHVKMNMDIGVVEGGQIRTVKPLGQIDPQECGDL